MAQEVEHGPLGEAPLERLPHDPQKPLQPPAAVAEGADVADGAHGHFDQAAGVDERLGATLGKGDALDHRG